MTQLILIAFPLAAAFAELSVDELPAPVVDLAESEGNVADSSSRRLIGPPNTWRVDEWSINHIHRENDPGCPYEEPLGGNWCSEHQTSLECYYDEICCPDHKRCTARKIAHCVHLLGPNPNTYSWSVSNYGQRYRHHGTCYLGHASSDGRRRTDDELRRVMPEMDVQTDSDGIQQDSSLSRRMIGPARTWPVSRWSPNPRNCPRDLPGHGAWGNDRNRGQTCRYEKVCCPDRKRCVAHKEATCELMLPSGCKWQVSYYGQRDYKHGVCRIVHSSDTGDVPSNFPSYNPIVFG